MQEGRRLSLTHVRALKDGGCVGACMHAQGRQAHISGASGENTGQECFFFASLDPDPRRQGHACGMYVGCLSEGA